MNAGILLPSVGPAIDWDAIDEAITGGESVSGDGLLGVTLPGQFEAYDEALTAFEAPSTGAGTGDDTG